MQLRSITSYRTMYGRKRRRVRLYQSWRNLLARVRGQITGPNGVAYWKGLPVEWATFAEFRAWALAAGYSRTRCSLDRIDPQQGYSAENCRWLTPSENTSWMQKTKRIKESKW